jgi:tripartite-type tricarboxylate transporter receptor subunit TctC
VRVVVPFPAGGSTDRMTRLVAEELTKVFKQQFVVENRPGAGGAVGATQVARAEPDGYTLMAGGFGPHILGPASGVKVDYDPIADFTHIAMMGGETYIFAAHSALGVKSLVDVVRLAGEKPINFGSPGTGTLGQLMVDQFRLGSERTGSATCSIVAALRSRPISSAITFRSQRFRSRRCSRTSRPERSFRLQ